MPACAGTAFARFAARTGAVVIPGFALWSEPEQRYILRFYPPVPITGDTAEDTQRLHSAFWRASSASTPINGSGSTGAGRNARRASPHFTNRVRLNPCRVISANLIR